MHHDKPHTFRYHHERLRIDDTEHFFPVVASLISNGFVVWSEEVARPGDITNVDIRELFICYCRLSDFDGETRMRVHMNSAELTCGVCNPDTHNPCIRAKHHDGFCCDVYGAFFWDDSGDVRLYESCDAPNKNTGKDCLLGKDHAGPCFDGYNFFTNAKRNHDKGIEQPAVYYELLGHLMAELNVPGALTFWEAVDFLKNERTKTGKASLVTNVEEWKASACVDVCGQNHPIAEIGGTCILARDHTGFHKTSANQGWFSAEGRDLSYRCDSGHCPGYSWPHTAAPHPMNTCPAREDEPSKKTP